MTQPSFRERAANEGLITALAIGGFLIILGAVFGLTPGIPNQLIDFFSDFSIKNYGALFLPAPAHPAQHLDVYTAVFNFMAGIGVLQIAILALRLFYRSPFRRISETIGNLIFWFGGAIVAQMFLLNGTLEGWFQFWAALIIIVGVSLVVRGIIHFSRALYRHDRLW